MERGPGRPTLSRREDNPMQTPDLEKPLRLHPLVYLDEGEDVTVGRPDVNSYGVFPSDGAALLRRLESGDTPRQAAEWYRTHYGETVDMGEFIEVLQEYD